uniref:Uncharacterized protein n=1 Tax=Plectus sambesii TaxID=2011161 RepID=A0A914VEF9_9BILA
MLLLLPTRQSHLCPFVLLLFINVLNLCVLSSQAREDNCISLKLKDIVLEAVSVYPHQYGNQARYMKQLAEERFGHWWSAVIVNDRGTYGMSAVYDSYRNTSCEIKLFDVYYWLGRTC